MEIPAAYIPMDRRQSLVAGTALPERDQGAAIFADISGFTPLTEALARELGPQRGAEELTVHLNHVYDALIAELHHYGGSVTGFSGDAITCWLSGDDGRRATAVALAMQDTMRQFAEVRTHSGRVVSLGMKAAVAAGPVRRFLAGDPDYLVVDVMAGATLERLAATEHHAERGEVVLDAATAEALGPALEVGSWRAGPGPGERYAVAGALPVAPPAAPWPSLPGAALAEEQVRPWLLPSLRERLYRGQGEFLAELRPAVALFLRFSGIDYIGDPAAPARLNELVVACEQVLWRYDASLIQLTVGDKGSYLYAAFGAPTAHEDDASRAAAAALELQAAAARLAFLTPLQIGITQGRMRTGPYGSATQRTYGVLGDAVNLAARLMAAAEPGQILVSQLAQQATGDGFTWELRPAIRVKGKSEPVPVALLTGTSGQRALRLAEPRYALPMVGREAELALIGSKRRLAWRGEGQIVGLSGEAGMGKSRLVAEVIALAYQQGFAGYGGEAQSYGTNISYLAWQTIWRGLFGLEAGASLAEQVEALAAQLAAIDPSFVPRLPLLGPVLNLSIPDNDLTRTFDARLRKASLEALLVDCLAAFSRARPLLLVLEDCHWLDPLSHDLVEQIGRAIAGLPVLMLLAYRPADQQGFQAPRVTQLPHFIAVGLKDFTREEAERFIRLKLAQMLGDQVAVPAEFSRRIAERAAGNPFYIEELLNYLRDRNIDPANTAALDTLDLPSSLYSLILTRIDQLNESQKTTIKVASVIGRLFPAAMVWGVYPELGEAEHVARDLQVLSNLDLTPLDTPEPELTYLFKHVITQQVAYESLLYATRAMLHNQIGQFIERNYRGTLDRYVDLLAYHYSRSKNQAKQREYLLRAGRAAQAAYANPAAIDYYERALPLLSPMEQVATLISLGEIQELVGEWDEGGALYRRALALAESIPDGPGRARAQMALGRLLRRQGAYAEALTWLAEARAGFDAVADPAGVSQVLEATGEVYRLQSAYAQARDHYEQSLRLAAGVTPPELSLRLRALALKGAGALGIYEGDFVTARARYHESLALLRQLGDKPNVANVLSNLGVVARREGDLPTAERRYRESLTMGRELGDRWGVASSLGNLGMVARDLGDYEAAASLYEECLALYRQLGERNFAALALNNLGDVRYDQGAYDEARGLYTESLQIQAAVGDQWAIAYLIEAFAGVAHAESRPARALRLAGFAARLRAAIHAPLSAGEQDRVDAMLAAARALLAPDEAAAAWEAGRALPLAAAVAYALAGAA